MFGRTRELLTVTVLVILMAGTMAIARHRAGPRTTGLASGTALRGSLAIDTLERTFLYHVPPGPRRGAALVLALHGSGGTGARLRSFVGAEFERLADERGFFVAYPDGYSGNWNDCRAKARFRANLLGVDDVSFLRGVVDYFRHNFDVEPANVRVFGFSNGAHMAYRLALEIPKEVQAVVAIGANLPVEEELDCPATMRAVPAMMVAGTEDRINPYVGGTVSLPGGGNAGSVQSAEQTARYFARVAGHHGVPQPERLFGVSDGDSLAVERRQWVLPGRPEVVLYTVLGGGHTIPGPSIRLPAFLGATERRFDAVREAVLFYERNAASGAPAQKAAAAR